MLVDVADPPEITLRPRNQQVKAGRIAAFYCAARGDPSPVITWRKNGKKVSNTQSRYLVQEFNQVTALVYRYQYYTCTVQRL